MKMDKIIRNPPYKGSTGLYLNITEKAFCHSNELVVLAPDNWRSHTEGNQYYQDLLYPYIEHVDVIHYKDAQKIFRARIQSNLSIIKLSKNSNGFSDESYFFEKNLYKKIRWDFPSFLSRVNKGEKTEYFLKLRGCSGYAKCNPIKIENIFGNDTFNFIYFASEEEKNNLLDSLKLNIYKYIYYLDGNASVPSHFPWLGNAINPRTGKVGYLSDWCNDDVYKLLCLDNKEIHYIESIS